jgi:hypothetical protein
MTTDTIAAPICKYCDTAIPQGVTRVDKWLQRQYCDRNCKTLDLRARLDNSTEPPICKYCNAAIPRGNRGVVEWVEKVYCNQVCKGHGQGMEARAALIENIEFLLDPTAPRQPRDDIARRLGYKNRKSLARRLRNHGCLDLATFFDTEYAA